MVMLAVSAWQLRHRGDREVFTRSARLALVVLVPAILFTMLVGDELGVIEAKYQPMKIAAAEAQWTTCQPCSFSLFQIGGGNNDQTPTEIIAIPHLLSLLATNHWNGQVVGLDPLQQQYSKQYGPGNYVPNVFIQYWGMRVMAYGGVLVLLISVWGLWLIRRKTLATSRVFLWVAVWAAVLPFVMNTAGWFLTESGRQPWIVQGIMLTKNGISPTVSATWLVDQPDRLHRAVRHARHRRPALDAAVLAQAAPARPRRGRRGHAGTGRSVLGVTMSSLVPFWFIVIAILWTGFFILEGFDFGVGMLHSAVGRDEAGRRAAINTIGPLWDGNEVWLIVAGAAMFAAFPGWYATMFSACYLALVLLLAALIVRGVAFEYRGKRDAARWRRTWDVAADRRQRAGPAADRHRPRRPAARPAHQLGPGLHRVVLGPAPALRAVHRDHPGPDLPAARRHVPVPEDHRRHARAVLAGGPPRRPVHRRRSSSASSSGPT